MAVSAGLLETSSVRHKNIHHLRYGHDILETQQEELMPKEDKDVCIKMFCGELKNQLGMMTSSCPRHFGGGFQAQD